jgi:hypothetical protein
LLKKQLHDFVEEHKNNISLRFEGDFVYIRKIFSFVSRINVEITFF